MSTLILGSKPLDRGASLGEYTNILAANGAIKTAASVAFASEVISVCTPYIFLDTSVGGPYKGRERLRLAMLEAINEARPPRIVLRPVTVASEAQIIRSVQKSLGYPPLTVTVMKPSSLSWRLLRLSGAAVGPAAWQMCNSRIHGRFPIQERNWKVSTGVLALAIAFSLKLNQVFPITLAGVGVTGAPYPESPGFVADRAPHVEADVLFLTAFRRELGPGMLSIADPELESVTRPC